MPNPTLPDKMQLLALRRPLALAIVERLVDGLLKHAAHDDPTDWYPEN
jgi:hypothetical protein